MGNCSYIQDSNLHLNCSKKKFLRKLLPYILGCCTKKDNEDEFDKKVIEYLTLFTNNEIEAIEYEAVALYIANVGKTHPYVWNALKLDKDQPDLEIDGWKIQGYWYQDFCVFLYHLWHCGLRGYIGLNEEQNQDFIIRFEDDDIHVDFYPVVGYNEGEESLSSIDQGIEKTYRLQEIGFNRFEEEEAYLPYLQ